MTAQKPDRVLLVDDDPAFLELLSHVLKARGKEVVTAEDGREALDLARGDVPDLIILDINMPEMDGFTLIRHLRSESAFALVPVIFLTDRTDAESRLKGFHLGADDFLGKDTVLDELSVRVDRALRRRLEVTEALMEGGRREGEPAFQGTLDQVGLSSVLTILEMEGRTGRLHLEDEVSGDAAAILLRGGQVLTAHIPGKESTEAIQTVAAVLAWSRGRFSFEVEEVDAPDEIGQSTTSLLMTAAWLLDESGRDQQG